MTANDLNIKVTFDRTTGFIVVEDITDYIGLSIDPADVFGYLKITYNVGAGDVQIYNNLYGGTPDITSPTFINATDIAFPLDSSGNPLPASYTVLYQMWNDDPLLEYDFQKSFSYEYNFVDPEVCLSSSVNCATSVLTSTDVTNYDSPQYATRQSLSRTHTLYPPPTSGGFETSNSLASLSVSPIYTGTYTAEIISEVTYLQGDGLYITLELSGTKEIVVTCDTNLSKILCCIATIDETYNSYLCKDPVKAQNYADRVVIPVWRYLVLFLAATTAGNQNKAAAAYANILEYSGCEDCGCGDEITLVTPSVGGATQTYSVTSPDNSVSVVTVVTGSNTEFQLQVSATIQNIINNLGNAISVVSGDSYITVVASGSNPRVFTVTWSGPVPHEEQLVQKQFIINPPEDDIDYMTMNTVEINNVGPDVATPPHNQYLGAASPNISTSPALIRVYDFLLPATNKKYIVQANIMRYNSGYPTYGNSMTEIKAEAFWADVSSSQVGDLYIRFIETSTGAPVPDLEALSNYMSGHIMYVALEVIIEP